MKDLFSVKNQVVLITGSTHGLGFSFAKGFIDAGAHVVINGRKQADVDQVVEQFRVQGGKASGAAFDVTDQEEVVYEVVYCAVYV